MTPTTDVEAPVAGRAPAAYDPVRDADAAVPAATDPLSGRVRPTIVREGEPSALSLQRDSRIRRSLAIADVAAVAVALSAVILLAGQQPRPALIVLLPLVVAVSKIVGLYDRDSVLMHKTTLDETPLVLNMATTFTLLVWLFESAIVRGELAAPYVALLWLSLPAMMLMARSIARALAVRSMPPERCLVIGDERATEWLRRKMTVRPSASTYIVESVPWPFADNGEDDSLQATVDDLTNLICDWEIDRVVVAPAGQPSLEVLNVIRAVKSLGVKVSVVPRMMEAIGSSVEFEEVDGVPVLGLRRYALSDSSQKLKRAFDVAGSAAALVLLSPLMALIALAIKLTSRGPILFSQPRVGRDGELFRMKKFRTMRDGADADKESLRHLNQAQGFFKIPDDPRTTRVGRFLRRTSLDELPQLLNVLAGQMSLVGPRPLVPEEDRRIEGWERQRHVITPGMTGVWQVLGSSSRIPINEMVKLDYLYRTNWSLWLDVKILLRTIPHVLFQRGL